MKRYFRLVLIVLAAAALSVLWAGSGLSGNAALAEPGGNSAGYTVDFEYQGVTYSIRGQGCCALDRIFDRMGIEGEIQDARLDLTAGEDIEGALTLTKEAGGWYLTSEVPFDSAYALTADVDGRTVTVRVTDSNPEAQNASVMLKTFNRVPLKIVWEDEGNRDGVRPAGITLSLVNEADGKNSSTVTIKQQDGKDTWDGGYFFGQTLSEDGTALSLKIIVNEVIGQDGLVYRAAGSRFSTGQAKAYTADWSGSPEEGYTVTCRYAPEKTSFTVVKIWRDEDNRDGVRPESVTLTLLANGESTGTVAAVQGEKTAQRWTYTFKNLYKYQDGKEITYSALETGMAGLTWKTGRNAAWYDGDTPVYTAWNGRASKLVEGQYQIVDQHDPAMVTVVAGKEWADSGNTDGVRPTSVTLTVYADGRAVPENGESVTITLDGETDTGLKARDRGEKAPWRAHFTDLPRYRDGGVPIVYTVRETAMSTKGIRWTSADGGVTWTSILSRNPYVSSGEANTRNSYMITNSHQPSPVKAELVVVWEDGDDAAGLRPETLEAVLLADGAEYSAFTLDEAQGWKAEKSGLQPFADEKKIEYVWQIEAPQSYFEPEGSRRTELVNNGGTVRTTVVFRYESAEVQPSVSVVWQDGDAPEGSRPESVSVRLLADGEVREAAALTAENGWTAEFGGTARRGTDGSLIAYTVEQDKVSGYKTEITGDADTGFVITNTYYTATGSVRLTAEKLVSGEEPTEKDDTFSFELYTAEADENGTTLLKAADYPIAMVNNSGSSVSFPEIAYDVNEAGKTYWFMVSEVVPEGSMNYLYDFTRFVAGVTVTDNGDGTLNTDTAWYEMDEESRALTAVSKASFNNVRQEPASLSVTLSATGTKTTRHFDFTLILKDENGVPLTGSYAYVIQDGDGRAVEEGAFNLDDSSITPKGTDGSIAFRLADGDMLIVKDLPVSSTYTVKQKTIKAYVTSTQENGQTNMVSGEIVEGGAHVDFLNAEVTTDFTVRKVWQGGDPGWSISLTLGTAPDGEFISLYPQPAYTREGNMYTFKDLPKYDEDDRLIVYAAKEAPIANYDLVRYRSPNSNATSYVLDGGTITNGKTSDFKVKKVWTGVQEGETLPPFTLVLWQIQPDSTYSLYKTIKVEKPEKLEQWFTFSALPEGYTYYVTEDAPAGYSVSYSNINGSEETEYAENMGTITNHKIPKTGDSDPVGLWTAMFLTGLIGLTVLALLRGKKKQENEV